VDAGALARSDTPRRRILAAALLIGLIALADWRIETDVAFGFLYLIPLILLGTVLTGWQIVLVAAVCAGLADFFDPHSYAIGIAIPHDILVLTSLGGTGLFARAIIMGRRREREHLESVEREAAARREVEEQLEFLVKTSPAAVLTMATDGEILLANPAAHHLFRIPAGGLPGRNIGQYVPTLRRVPLLGGPVQSEVQCRGTRDTGQTFLADVFFATYETTVGFRIAALVIDVSEALRERELSSLEQFLAGSRVLMGAVSHEVRNVSNALAVITQNLVRTHRGGPDQDVEALGALVGTLRQIASAELKQHAEASWATGVDLADLLAELRIVLDRYCDEAGIELRWVDAMQSPTVWADRHRLLQVLLNLVRNSERAMAESAARRIDVAASVNGTVASIRVTDTGPGLRTTDHLFEPFQSGAHSTGLGLYLSRALLRSFQADLRHDPSSPGCCFVIDLPLVNSHEVRGDTSTRYDTNPIAVG
jgi:two-component system, LuxR family, sensor kinase FixL